jgi:hypothetical protein
MLTMEKFRQMARTTSPKNRKQRQVARAKATPKAPIAQATSDVAKPPERSVTTLMEDETIAATPLPGPIGFQVSQPTETPRNATRSSNRQVKPYQTRRKTLAIGRAPASISTALPREQEYAFIRADLQRLLLIAGVLTVVMILLLFVVDR